MKRQTSFDPGSRKSECQQYEHLIQNCLVTEKLSVVTRSTQTNPSVETGGANTKLQIKQYKPDKSMRGEQNKVKIQPASIRSTLMDISPQEQVPVQEQ